MLGIAKKIYNGATDQRVFRILILVSMFFVYMELTTQSEKIQSAVRTLSGIRSETAYLETRSGQIRDSVSSIEDEVELIRSISGEISSHTNRIKNNTY